MASKDASCPVGEKVIPIPIPRNVTEQMEVDVPSIPTGEVVAMVIFYLIIINIAGFGNILLIYVIARRKGLQTRTNVYVANLATSDLLVTLTCMWVHLGNSISPAWRFGQFFCKSLSFFQSWAVTSSVLFMTLIAGNRFFAIVFPLKAHVSKNLAVVLITGVWITSGLVAVPHLIYHELYTIYWKNWVEIFCEDSWPRYYYNSNVGCLTHKPGKTIYVTCCAVILYFVPVVLMTFAYSSVAVALYKRQKTIEPNDSIRVQHQRTRFKVIRMLVAVLVGFTICWTPINIMLMYDVHRSRDAAIPDSFETIKFVCTYMAYANSALNPVIYVTLNDSFRNAFWQTLSKNNKVASADTPYFRTSNENQKTQARLRNTKPTGPTVDSNDTDKEPPSDAPQWKRF